MKSMEGNRKSVILEYIKKYYDRHGQNPAVHDISVGTGIPNTSVHRYLVSMKESGELDYSGRKCNIHILVAGQDHVFRVFASSAKVYESRLQELLPPEK